MYRLARLSYSTLQRNKYDNVTGTKLLKELYSKSNQNNAIDADKIILDAFRIYNNISNPKNHFVINTLLRVLLFAKKPETVNLIWSDIQKIEKISYPLLLKCFIKIENHKNIQSQFDIDKCFQILQWIKQSQTPLNKYELTDYSVSVTKLISKCDNIDDLERIHDLIPTIYSDTFIKSALITKYGKFKSKIEDAKAIFDSIPCDKIDEVIIGGMMKAFINNNCNYDAIDLYFGYQDLILTNDIAHMLAIKACSNADDFQQGILIHKNIKSLMQTDQYSMQLNNTLIDFYGTFGDIDQAKDIFDSIPNHKKDIVSVSTMMKCLMNNNLNSDALKLYESYSDLTNDVCHMLAIKACTNLRNYDKGKKIHDFLHNVGNKQSIQFQNTLIDFYGNFGFIDKAINVFKNIDAMEIDAVSLNAMMTVLINANRAIDALNFYDEYEHLHDDTSNMLGIKCCIITNNEYKGNHIIKFRIKNDTDYIELKNTLIDFYGTFNDISKAWDVFGSVADDKKEVVMINAMMKALINNTQSPLISNTQSRAALKLYDKYQKIVDDVSHLAAIKACSHTKDIDKLKEIEAKVKDIENVSILTALMDFYGAIGDVDRARNIFDSINVDQINSICVNAMLKALVKNDRNEEVLKLYDGNMHFQDDISHLSALMACINSENQEKGREIHRKMKEKDKVVSIEVDNVLIEFYGHFNDIGEAENVFAAISEDKKDVITINSMLTAYLDNNETQKVLNLYDKTLQSQPNLMDDITHLSAIRACIKSTDFDKGKEIYAKIATNQHGINLKNTLIDFYGHFFDIENAKAIYDTIKDNHKTIVTMGAMMESYCNCRMNMECIELFKQIKNINDNLKPNNICYAIVFKACTQAIALHLGQEIHETLKNDKDNNYILDDPLVQCHLIDMYSKCGSLSSSQKLFEEIKNETKHVNVWNAMIKAYATNGDIENVKHIYREMNNYAISKDVKTFTLLLNACNHVGQINDAINIWRNEIKDDRIKYDSYVMTCLVDCFGRKGMLDKAYEIILEYEQSKMDPDMNDIIMWKSLLSIFQNEQDFEIEQDNFIQSDNLNRDTSEIDICGKLYRFEGDAEQYPEIYNKLNEICAKLKEQGIETAGVINDSEILAVICGLIKTDRDYQIVVNKSTEMSDSGHNFMKALSKSERRKFIISDIHRVHVFDGGQCNGNEYT